MIIISVKKLVFLDYNKQDKVTLLVFMEVPKFNVSCKLL